MATAERSRRRRQKSGEAMWKPPEVSSAEASPDSKCPICLDRFHNMAYLDRCLHKFCFRCIHEWSKNKAECPLCKQPFNSIYHTIKSESDYVKYDLPPTENGSFGTFGNERFRYRTTLTRTTVMTTGTYRADQNRRRTFLPDNGVMFEGLASGPADPHIERGLRRIMVRLESQRRSEGEEVRRQEMVRFRRALYRHGLKVTSVVDGGRFRDTSADFYSRNPACLHRLVPWLKRELVVLYGAHGTLVNIVQHIIMSRITRYDMEDGAMQEELRPFLQGRTEHFLHEFISFARAPFNMEAYDRHAVYDLSALPFDDGSSSDNSVIDISEDEEGAGREGDSVDLDPPADFMSSGSLSQTAWDDDETPGPSYSTTLEAARAARLTVRDSETDSSLEDEPGECGDGAGALKRTGSLPRIKADSDLAEENRWRKFEGGGGCYEISDDDDCVIVGFVKPAVDRTPELVQLSSDSDESVLEGGSKEEAPRHLPQHIRFCSVSPPSQEQPREQVGEGVVDGKRNTSGCKKSRDASPSPSESRRIGLSGRSDGGEGERHARRRSPDRSRAKLRPSSRERRKRRSRSPATVISVSSDATAAVVSKGRRHSRSRSRERSSRSKGDGRSKRQDEDGGRSGRGHSGGASHTAGAAYHRHSHSKRYSRERDGGGGGTVYSERKSYYSSSRRDSERGSRSRSKSRSPESHRRRRRGSRSRSHSNSLASPPSSSRKSHHDKPGGKRKYKTRHLEESAVAVADPSSKSSYPEPDTTTSSTKHEKRSREKKGKRSKEKSGKRSRSSSVEIVHEGSPPPEEHARRHRKKKKKHKKKSKRHRSKERTRKHSTTTIITIDSDSDHSANGATTRTCNASSGTSPIKTAVTDNPADSSLLESMTQTWEKQIPPVASEDGVKGVKPEYSPAATSSDETTLEHLNNVPSSTKKAQHIYFDERSE